MLTLVFSSANLLTTLELSQEITAWVTLALDIFGALVILYKAIKGKHITVASLIKFFKKPKNVKKITTELENIINQLSETPEESERQGTEPEIIKKDE